MIDVSSELAVSERPSACVRCGTIYGIIRDWPALYNVVSTSQPGKGHSARARADEGHHCLRFLAPKRNLASTGHNPWLQYPQLPVAHRCWHACAPRHVSSLVNPRYPTTPPSRPLQHSQIGCRLSGRAANGYRMMGDGRSRLAALASTAVPRDCKPLG